MEEGGNKKVNAIWEGKILFDTPRPNAMSDPTAREDFARDKYEDRKYFSESLLKKELKKGQPVALTLKASSSDTASSRKKTLNVEADPLSNKMAMAAADKLMAIAKNRTAGQAGKPASSSRNLSLEDSAASFGHDFDAGGQFGGDASGWWHPNGDGELEPAEYTMTLAPPSEDNEPRRGVRRTRSGAGPRRARAAVPDSLSRSDHGNVDPATVRRMSRRSSVGMVSHPNSGDDGLRRMPSRRGSMLATTSNHSSTSSGEQRLGYGEEDSSPQQPGGAASKRLAMRRASMGISSQPMDDHTSTVPPVYTKQSQRHLTTGSNHSITDISEQIDRESLGYGDDEPPARPQSMRRMGRRSSLVESKSRSSRDVTGRRSSRNLNPSASSDDEDVLEAKTEPKRGVRSAKSFDAKPASRRKRSTQLPDSLQSLPTKSDSNDTVATESCSDSSNSSEEKAVVQPKSSKNMLASLYAGDDVAADVEVEISRPASSRRMRPARRSSCVM